MFAFVAPPPLDAAAYTSGSYWAAGVSEKNGWYDVNKNGGDSELCWAASACNIIAWWQDRVGKSNIPSGIPKETADEIYSTLKASFNNVPYSATFAWGWYFGGYPFGSNDIAEKFKNQNSLGGGYYTDYVTSSGWSTDSTFEPKYATQTSVAENSSTQGAAEKFVPGICDDLRAGYGVSFSVIRGSTGHQLTLWGVEIDEIDQVVIYFTDSDDGEDKLRSTSLVFKDISHEATSDKEEDAAWTETQILLKDYNGTATYRIVGWETLMLPYAIPEPSAFGLFAGTLALAFVAARRRRIK